MSLILKDAKRRGARGTIPSAHDRTEQIQCIKIMWTTE
jgi:hypothetical protein